MSRKINPGIYMIAHIDSGKKYIGSSVTPKERLSVHKRELRVGNHSNLHLQNAWNLYGEDSFTFSVTEENLSTDILESKENEYIINFGIADAITGKFFEDRGYNMCWAGREGFKDSSLRKSGRDHHLYGKSSWSKGKTLSQEHKKNISDNNGNIKTYILIDNNDTEIIVTNLNKFCRENNYSTQSLSHFKVGKVKKWYCYKSISLKGSI